MQRYGESAADASNSGNRPSFRPALGMLEQPLERQLVSVGGDEIVPQIPSRNRARQAEVERIERFGQAGGLIDGFTERVSNHRVQAPAGVPQARLERIVVGVPDTGVIVVVTEIWTQRSSSSVGVLLEWAATRQRQTQSRIAGIGRVRH